MPQFFTELKPVTITTTGSAGSATGSGSTTEIVNGVLYALYLNYHASASATTKLVIQTTINGVTRILWTGTSSNNGIGATDILIFPRVGVTATELIPLAGTKITFAVSLSNALTGALVISPIVVH